MSFNCICVKTAATQDCYTVRVRLLDNTVSEYSLENSSTGEDCVRKIAAEVELKEVGTQFIVYIVHDASLSKLMRSNLSSEIKGVWGEFCEQQTSTGSAVSSTF